MARHPHAITVAAFVICSVLLGISGWFIQRNLRHNAPGLRAPLAFSFALIISASGVFGPTRLPSSWGLLVGIIIRVLAALLFYHADHRRFVRNPAGKIVADRWQIVLTFAGFQWTRDKANRHFFFSGDTGSGKISGMTACWTRSSSAIPRWRRGYGQQGRRVVLPRMARKEIRPRERHHPAPPAPRRRPNDRSIGSTSRATHACHSRDAPEFWSIPPRP